MLSSSMPEYSSHYYSSIKYGWKGYQNQPLSYLWVRFEALGSTIWAQTHAAAWWRHRDLLSPPEPIWHLPQALNSLTQHKQVNKPCVFNTPQKFILKGAGEKKEKEKKVGRKGSVWLFVQQATHCSSWSGLIPCTDIIICMLC